jgi:4-methylaminobutanoate oxidase (formaldehyde-forming)
VAEPFPTSASAVVIGGGVIGCSVAYHLAKLGWSDVVLLERSKLTSGTTWHAAGLVVTSGFTTETSVELARYTRDLYAGLEEETGFATGFNPVGLLQIAANEEILLDLRRKASFNRLLGVESRELSRAEVKEMWPLARTEDVLAGFYTEGDGRANPVDLTVSLAKGATARGVRVLEDVAVNGVLQSGGRATGVVTDRGEISSDYVVNCAGMWARQIGDWAGVSVPLQAAEHYYVILEGVEVDRRWPVLEDPSCYAYLRDEGGRPGPSMPFPRASPSASSRRTWIA